MAVEIGRHTLLLAAPKQGRRDCEVRGKCGQPSPRWRHVGKSDLKSVSEARNKIGQCARFIRTLRPTEVMTRRRAVTIGVLLGSMTGVVLGGCATGTPKTSTEQVVNERQRIMKWQGATMQLLRLKLKTGNFDGIALNVETLVVTSEQIPQLFPEGSLSDKSRAKPAIWEKWSEFEGYARSLRTQAMKVADLVRENDKASIEAAVAEMSRTTCVACHDAFRGPGHP